MTKPIFVVCAPRSGSTLLRLILDAHPNIALPPPAWLYELIRPYLYSYGDLGSAENFQELCEDVLETPTIKRWNLNLTPAMLAGVCREQSFRGVFEAVHVTYGEINGKHRWGEKTPRNSFWIDEIKNDFPKAKIIHIVRDGRDMAIDIADSTSMRPYTLYMGGQYWVRYVSAIRDSAQRLPTEDFHEIRYEDLCADPERTLKVLCAFLNEDYDQSMLSFHESRSTKNWSTDPQHAKVAQPISDKFCGMYKRRIPENDAFVLERMFGDLLKEYGYPTTGNGITLPTRTAEQMIQSDLVTSPENYQYKAWHVERRNLRRERGVYKASDRESFLWSLQ